MAASDNLSGQQFMYHVSSALNRESIQANGLDKNRSSLGPRVYVSDEDGANFRAKGGGYDIWKVDVSGVPLREDKIDGGRARYSQRSLPPGRISLHKAGEPGQVF